MIALISARGKPLGPLADPTGRHPHWDGRLANQIMICGVGLSSVPRFFILGAPRLITAERERIQLTPAHQKSLDVVQVDR